MKFSDEMINAYADGELQGREKAEFEQVLQYDSELQLAVENISDMKAQLHDAYHRVDIRHQVQRNTVTHRVAAYAALLVLVFASGWLGSDLMHGSTGTYLSSTFYSDGVKAGEQVNGKFVLHIGTHDHVKFKRTLDEIESLLVNYQSEAQPIELEVIANAGGLNLLREDGSPFAEKVKQISQEYPNVRFIACSNAIERLREQGIEPDFINAVQQGPTALDQVVRRMNEGWTYIKI